jgi:hypothetical protein
MDLRDLFNILATDTKVGFCQMSKKNYKSTFVYLENEL